MRVECPTCGTPMREVERNLAASMSAYGPHLYEHIVGCRNEHCDDYAVLRVWFDDPDRKDWEEPQLFDCEPPYVKEPAEVTIVCFNGVEQVVEE